MATLTAAFALFGATIGWKSFREIAIMEASPKLRQGDSEQALVYLTSVPKASDTFAHEVRAVQVEHFGLTPRVESVCVSTP